MDVAQKMSPLRLLVIQPVKLSYVSKDTSLPEGPKVGEQVLRFTPKVQFDVSNRGGAWCSTAQIVVNVERKVGEGFESIAEFVVKVQAIYTSNDVSIPVNEVRKLVVGVFPMHIMPFLRERLYALSLWSTVGPVVLPLLDIRQELAELEKPQEHSSNTQMMI